VDDGEAKEVMMNQKRELTSQKKKGQSKTSVFLVRYAGRTDFPIPLHPYIVTSPPSPLLQNASDRPSPHVKRYDRIRQSKC
jgi:hypothetical protein